MIKQDIEKQESKISFKYGVHYSNEDKIEKTLQSIEELKEELQENKQKDVETLSEFERPENIEWKIEEYEKELSRLKKENVKLPCYKSKDYVERLLIKEQLIDILTNWEDAKEYQELKKEHEKLTKQYLKIKNSYTDFEYDDYGCATPIRTYEMDEIDKDDFEILDKEIKQITKRLKIIEKQALETANDMVAGLSTNEFNESYYLLSGQKEHDEMLKVLNNLKQQFEIVEIIISDYQNEKLKITMEQMDNFVKMFNKYINEFDDFKDVKPIDEAYNVPLCKVKYLNKIYEVYDFEIVDSCLVDFRKCKDLNGKQKVFQNKYFLEVQATQEDIKPVDKIEIDGVKYDVYKQAVKPRDAKSIFNNSIKKDRIKRKSLITNKIRDFRNVYLVKCD